MTTTTSKFDVAKYLGDEETIANYLDDCLEEGGALLFLKAVGEVARAKGMSEVASSAGLTRASLYKSLGEGGNPALSTMERVIGTLGLRLGVVRKERPESEVVEKPEVKPRRRVAAEEIASLKSRPIERRMGEMHTMYAAKRSGTSGATSFREATTGRFVESSKDSPRTTVKERTSAPKKKKPA